MVVRSSRPDVWTYVVRGGRPSDSFSSLWAAFTLNVDINALYIMKVYMQRKNKQLELIRFS